MPAELLDEPSSQGGNVPLPASLKKFKMIVTAHDRADAHCFTLSWLTSAGNLHALTCLHLDLGPHQELKLEMRELSKLMLLRISCGQLFGCVSASCLRALHLELSHGFNWSLLTGLHSLEYLNITIRRTTRRGTRGAHIASKAVDFVCCPAACLTSIRLFQFSGFSLKEDGCFKGIRTDRLQRFSLLLSQPQLSVFCLDHLREAGALRWSTRMVQQSSAKPSHFILTIQGNGH